MAVWGYAVVQGLVKDAGVREVVVLIHASGENLSITFNRIYCCGCHLFYFDPLPDKECCCHANMSIP